MRAYAIKECLTIKEKPTTHTHLVHKHIDTQHKVIVLSCVHFSFKLCLYSWNPFFIRECEKKKTRKRNKRIERKKKIIIATTCRTTLLPVTITIYFCFSFYLFHLNKKKKKTKIREKTETESYFHLSFVTHLHTL